MKWGKSESYITFFADGRMMSYPCYPHASHVWTVREAWKDFSRSLRVTGIRTGRMQITFTTDQQF